MGKMVVVLVDTEYPEAVGELRYVYDGDGFAVGRVLDVFEPTVLPEVH